MKRKAPEWAPKAGRALSGREQSGRRRKRLDRGGPRLGREKQGREALRSLISKFSLKIAEIFAVFFPKFRKFCQTFAEFFADFLKQNFAKIVRIC